MADLCLHTGGYKADWEQVAAVITPAAEGIWHPVPHAQMAGMVRDSLQEAGYSILNQAHGLARDGARYFGLLEVRPPAGLEVATDHGLIVGLRNSHDQAFRAGVSMGSHVFVCDNLAFVGEVVLGRRHTTNILRDLPKMTVAAVGKLGLLGRQQEERFDRYKTVEVSSRDANDLLVRSVEAGVLPVTKLPLALKEWKAPRHQEFSTGGPTLWRLYNAITEAIKGRVEPVRLATPAIHGLFDSAAGYAAETQQTQAV